MILTRENIAGYLLTLELVEAGYHITYDEIIEMYSAKGFLEDWRFNEEYTITYEQNLKWFKKASKIMQDTFYWHPRECDKYVGWIELASGLKIKG
jgi:hypothetical protein